MHDILLGNPDVQSSSGIVFIVPCMSNKAGVLLLTLQRLARGCMFSMVFFSYAVKTALTSFFALLKPSLISMPANSKAKHVH